MKTEDRYIEWVAGLSHCIYDKKIKKQVDLANEAGISKEHLNAIIKNRGGRRAGDTLQDTISHALGLSYDQVRSLGRWIIDGKDPKDWKPSTRDAEPSNVSPGPSLDHALKIPIISWVQAGDWKDVFDPYQPGDADDWIKTTETNNPNAFALIVNGDSMEPEFADGDIITVDPGREAENGSYVVAKNGDGEATFKQLVIDGNSVFLKPKNDRYPIKDITGKETKIVGVVVEKRKRY